MQVKRTFAVYKKEKSRHHLLLSETRNKFMSRKSNQTYWYLGEDISEVQGSFGPMESELDVLQMVVKIKCQGI